MIAELVAAAALGGLLLWMALSPLGTARNDADELDFDPIDETPRGRALLAIRDLEFDRETGKIGDQDFTTLKAKLNWEALQALEQSGGGPTAEGAPAAGRAATAAPAACRTCGPRPESDAVFCSRCGSRLPT